MNISLTKKQEAYIAHQIETGDFQNASELVRDALQLHQIYREKLILDLKQKIEAGWQSPDSKKNIQDILKEKRKNL